jgi:hypothetical protein
MVTGFWLADVSVRPTVVYAEITVPLMNASR